MINFESFVLRTIVLSCAFGFGVAGVAYADEDDAPQEKVSASVSKESSAHSAKADDVQEHGVVWLKDGDKEGVNGQPYCREFAPTGTRIKQRRCISAKQRALEEKAGKKYLQHFQNRSR